MSVVTERPSTNTAALKKLGGQLSAAYREWQGAEAELRGADHRRLTLAVRLGGILVAAKAEVPHGKWTRWVARHCPRVTTRTVQLWTRAAKRWPEIQEAAKAQNTSLSTLGLGRALKLVASAKEGDGRTTRRRKQVRLTLPAAVFSADLRHQLADGTAHVVSLVVRGADGKEVEVQAEVVQGAKGGAV